MLQNIPLIDITNKLVLFPHCPGTFLIMNCLIQLPKTAIPFDTPRILPPPVYAVATRATVLPSAQKNVQAIQSILSSLCGPETTSRQQMENMSASCPMSEAPVIQKSQTVMALTLAPCVATPTMVQKTAPETDLSKVLYI